MKYYMSKGVRKRLRRAIRAEIKALQAHAATGDTLVSDDDVVDLESLLAAVERCPVGRLVPDDFDPDVAFETEPTDNVRIAAAISYYKIMESLAGA